MSPGRLLCSWQKAMSIRFPTARIHHTDLIGGVMSSRTPNGSASAVSAASPAAISRRLGIAEG